MPLVVFLRIVSSSKSGNAVTVLTVGEKIAVPGEELSFSDLKKSLQKPQRPID